LHVPQSVFSQQPSARQQVPLAMQPVPQRVKPERHWVVEQLPFTQAKLPLQVSVSVQPDPSGAQV
jgi:hypothetical protein